MKVKVRAIEPMGLAMVGHMGPVIEDILPKLSTRAKNVIFLGLYPDILPEYTKRVPLAELRRAVESGELALAPNCGVTTVHEIKRALGMAGSRRKQEKGITLGPHQTDDLLATLRNARDFCGVNGSSRTLLDWLRKCERRIEKARRAKK
jgi:hypothetical protein